MNTFPWAYLAIPEVCRIDRRIFKKQFFENTRLTVTDKKWFTNDIETIIWRYAMKPSDTNINAITEEDYAYHEIAIIEVLLKKGGHVKRLSEVIHRGIPYPLMIVFKNEHIVRLSIADKRYNMADPQSATLRSLWVTGSMDPDHLTKIDREFLNLIGFPNQPKLHLKAFYHGWIDLFNTYDAAKISGMFAVPSDQEEKEHQIQGLEEYRDLVDRISDLKTELKKKEAFNEKVSLNMEIKKLESQMKQVARKL